jgi:hypothetical protein
VCDTQIPTEKVCMHESDVFVTLSLVLLTKLQALDLGMLVCGICCQSYNQLHSLSHVEPMLMKQNTGRGPSKGLLEMFTYRVQL